MGQAECCEGGGMTEGIEEAGVHMTQLVAWIVVPLMFWSLIAVGILYATGVL
jgi:hypothetical protein